jgi:hypothetical protein
VLLNKINRIINKGITFSVKPLETVSLLAFQIHDPIILSVIENSEYLAEGAIWKASFSYNNSMPSQMPIATEWVTNPIHSYLLKDVLTDVNTGVVFLPKSNKYILETSWGWGKYSTLKKQVSSKINTIKFSSNKPCYICSGIGYHGVVEDLASIFLLLDRGCIFSVVSMSDNKWMNGLLKFFLPTDVELIIFPRYSWIKAPLTYAVTKSSFGEFVNPKFIQRLNQASMDLNLTRSFEDIFISRADSSNRKFFGENKIANEYENLGYKNVVLADLSIEEQIALFKSAKRVAGLHGAGLVNLVWANPGVIVEEHYLNWYFNSCYSSICAYLGHDYKCFKIL